MEILVASSNAHKLMELAALFPGHDLKTPDQAGFPGFDVIEDGSTFHANAVLKALALHRLSGLPSLADDSGLAVRAMRGGPGIHSARYGSIDGSTKLSSRERNAILLAEMSGVGDRACAFICCLVLVLSESRIFSVQESCEGELLHAPRGEGGFGYDPVVWLPALGRTVAELDAEEKNRISHRGRAASRMVRILEDLARRP
jgi:XTP/dITP diphosphohydrolase